MDSAGDRSWLGKEFAIVFVDSIWNMRVGAGGIRDGGTEQEGKLDGGFLDGDFG